MKQESIIKQRNRPIDIARGVCIILMILIHIEAWWGKSREFFKYTGVFFLVFFFFCSGLFYKEPINKKKYLLKKFFHLEVPYMIVCLMVLVKRYCSGVRSISTLVNSFFYALPAKFESPYLLVGEKTTGIGPVWFLNCLFVSYCIYVSLGLCLRKIIYRGKQNDGSKLQVEAMLRTIVVVVLAVVASINQKYMVLPFNIQDGLVGMMFIHFGVLAAPYIKKIISGARVNILNTLVIFIFLVAIYYIDINYVPYQWLDLGSNKYNVQSLIGTFLGFLLLVLGAVFLEKVKWLGQLIAFIGLNSMVVLIIHAVDISVLRNWNHVGWAFVIATFLVYLGATYLYVELQRGKNGIKQESINEEDI